MPDERIFGVTFEDKLAKFGETPNIPQTFAENLMFGVIFGVLSGAVCGAYLAPWYPPNETLLLL